MSRRRHLFAGLILALIVLAVVVSVTSRGAPRPRSAAAPADAFSSARAMAALRVVAAEPHPIGSARQAAVRRYLVARLAALHLHPRVRESEVVSARETRVAGIVRNVVARLPGRDSSRAVLLVAHYDSVPTAAGAADDGSGVAALLETVRALRAGPRPRSDVIFLFTDGEEQGLLGVQGFLRDDPWAFAVGVVLNFDSAGSSSPALMYETSSGNGLLVAHYQAAGHAYGSSLMREVSRRQTVVSGFRPFVARGIPGMTFGMLDGPAYGHTAYDALASFDEAGLQHEGETALALARRLGDADLWRLRAADVIYFDVVGDVAVSYPMSWVVPTLALALALFAAAVVVAARRRLVTPRGLAWAALGTGATLGASLLVVGIVWTMYRTAYEERVWTGTGVVISDWYRLGLVLLAAGAVAALYAGMLRRLRAWDLAVLALAWWAGGAVVVTFVFPGASYVLVWPVAGASLGLVGAALVARREHGELVGALIALAGALPGLALLSSAAYLLLLSAGLKQSVTVLAVWLLAGLLVLPLAVVLRAFRFWMPVALAAVGLVVLLSVGSTVAFDSEHPKFTSVSYRVAPGGAATWQSVDRVNDYTRGFVGKFPSRLPLPVFFPRLGSRTTVQAAAPDYGVRRPRLTLLSDVTSGDRRTVRVRLRSVRNAAVLSLVVHTIVGTLSARVDGHELGGGDTTLLDGSAVRWSFDFYAPPPEGVVVTLDFAAGPRVVLRAMDLTYGLPAGAAGSYPARPAGMLPGHSGDTTIAEAVLRLPGESR